MHAAWPSQPLTHLASPLVLAGLVLLTGFLVTRLAFRNDVVGRFVTGVET